MANLIHPPAAPRPTFQNMKKLEVPPLTGTNLRLQLQWFPHLKPVLVESLKQWSSWQNQRVMDQARHIFCNLKASNKTSNKTSQFETSSKPWNQFEMSISCIWQPSYHMRRTYVKYTSSLDKNLDGTRLYCQVPLALEIQVAFGTMERWARLDYYTLRYTYLLFYMGAQGSIYLNVN